MVEGMILRNARAQIQRVLDEKEESVVLKHICVDEAFTILNDMHFVNREDFERNGWQVDYWTVRS